MCKSGVSVQPSRRSKKRPVKSNKKLCPWLVSYDGLTKKNEHRTSNIERPTSNNVFCQFKKKTEHSESTLRHLSVLVDLSAGGGFCGSFVIKSIKRSVINIQRSMFDVQSVHFSGQAESHTCIMRFHTWFQDLATRLPDTRNLTPKLCINI